MRSQNGILGAIRHARRWLDFVCLIVLLSWSSHAFADVPPVPNPNGWRLQCLVGTCSSPVGTNAACRAAAVARNTTCPEGWSHIWQSWSVTQDSYYCQGPTGYSNDLLCETSYYCEAGGILQGATGLCTVPASSSSSSSASSAQCEDNKGRTFSQWTNLQASQQVNSGCGNNGCMFSLSHCTGAKGTVGAGTGDTVTYCTFVGLAQSCGSSPPLPPARTPTYSVTGGSDSSSGAASSSGGAASSSGAASSAGGATSAPSCPECDCIAKGMGFGTVGGSVMCTSLPSSSVPVTTTSNSEVSVSSGTATSSGSGPGASPSASKSNTKTTCSNGSCTSTTTTTTTGPNGEQSTTTKTGSGSTKGEAEQKSLCQENPTLSICKEGTFSGACGAPPACSGDAVQCAQARYIFELDCKFKGPDDGTEALGRALVAGNDPRASENPALLANRLNTDISVGLNGAMSETFSAQCIADLSFAVSGVNVNIPMTTVCTWMGYIGNVGVMASLFLGMLIVGKGGS